MAHDGSCPTVTGLRDLSMAEELYLRAVESNPFDSVALTNYADFLETEKLDLEVAALDEEQRGGRDLLQESELAFLVVPLGFMSCVRLVRNDRTVPKLSAHMQVNSSMKAALWSSRPAGFLSSRNQTEDAELLYLYV
eukprot:754964-Hanusia_phi.AAC.4